MADSRRRDFALGLMRRGFSRCCIPTLGMGSIAAIFTLASPLPATASPLGTSTAAVPKTHAWLTASANLDLDREALRPEALRPEARIAAGGAIAPLPSPLVWVWMPPPFSLMTPWRTGQRPNMTGEFRVVGDRIYGPDGVEFVANGINVNGHNWVWPGSTLADADKIIEEWGFNSIRINFRLYTDDPDLPFHTDNNDLDAIIRTFTQRGVVVMLDGHDFIGGYYEGQALEDLKAWYRDYAQRYRDNPYVWFNIANEPGNVDSSRPENVQTWLTMHQEVIEVIRDDVGANNIIVIDGQYWGQDGGSWNNNDISRSSILNHGDRLRQFNGKTYGNLVFSIHAYDQWAHADSRDRFAAFFAAAAAQDLPLVVGEYGWSSVKPGFGADFRPATVNMIAEANPRNIGRWAWAWWGGDNFELTRDGNGGGQFTTFNATGQPTNLTPYGQLVWNELRRMETPAFRSQLDRLDAEDLNAAHRDVADRDVAARDAEDRDVADRDVTARDAEDRDVADRDVAARENRDAATHDRPPSPAQPLVPLRIEAEHMTREHYAIEAQDHASGGRLVRLDADTGSVAIAFPGPEGHYDLVVSYYDEGDGTGQLRVTIAGETIDRWTLDRPSPVNVAEPENQVSRTVVRDRPFRSGETITLEGWRDRAEQSRLDWIEFRPSRP